MKYRVLREIAYAIEYREDRDKPAGVRGVLMKGNDYLPAGTVLEGVVGEAESLEEAMALATAWRDANPEKTAHVIDEQNRVVQTLWRTDFSKERAAEARELRKWFGIGLFCVLFLNVVIGSSVLFFKGGAVLPVVSAIAALELLYAALVKLGMFNEIEGIHVSVIVSIIAWGILAYV